MLCSVLCSVVWCGAAIVTRIMKGHSDARSVDLEGCFLFSFLPAVHGMLCCVG